jgi:putative transposase
MATIRKVTLVSGEVYHIFNRGIDSRVTFSDNREYRRFMETLYYYIHSIPPIRLSRYVELKEPFKEKFMKESWGKNLVTIMDYCLMPNHFHIILKQEMENGISRFIGQLLNSYTRYFNIKNKRIGQLFLDQFKNVLVEDDGQLLHLSRYILLNSFSSGLIVNKEDIFTYKWSSFNKHFSKGVEKICNTDIVDSNFKSIDKFKKFILDNADYQKALKLSSRLFAE